MPLHDPNSPLMSSITMKVKANSEFNRLGEVEKAIIWGQTAAKVGLPYRHTHYNYDGTNEQTEASLKAICLLSGPYDRIDSVLIAGERSSGKTAYLCCMLRDLFYNWAKLSKNPVYMLPTQFSQNVRYISGTGLANAFYTDDSDVPEESALAALLIVDGLFDVEPTKWIVGKLSALIEKRWKDLQTTWIATKLTAKQIKRLPDSDRIVSCFSDSDWIRYFRLKNLEKGEKK